MRITVRYGFELKLGCGGTFQWWCEYRYSGVLVKEKKKVSPNFSKALGGKFMFKMLGRMVSNNMVVLSVGFLCFFFYGGFLPSRVEHLSRFADRGGNLPTCIARIRI